MTNAPTEFGPVNFAAKFTDQGMELHLDGHFRTAPDQVRVHLPWFVKVNSALVDGKPAVWNGREILLPPQSRQVVVDWQTTEPNLSAWSYDAEVQKFKNEWRERQRTAGTTGL
jgi:hypothetical protein